MTQFALSSSRKIISNSPLLLSDLNTTGQVIPYGVPPNPGRRLPHSGVSVAGAGRLVHHKGFHLLKAAYPAAEIISSLTIDQFRQKLLSVDIFVAPSLRDPLGNLDDANTVVLEAMAAGCAVIVSDLPGYRRLVTHGHNGYLFPPGNIRRLTSLIRQLVRRPDLRRQLGRNARLTLSRHFTPRHIAALYLRLFQHPHQLHA